MWSGARVAALTTGEIPAFHPYDRAMGETQTTRVTGRERVLEAAYELFSRQGLGATGVDTVTAEAGVAKMTLYRNFGSKDELALAFLQRREERWTYGWVGREVTERADTPAEMLLAIFDVFDEWFARDDYEGCPFISFVLELSDRDNPVRQAAVRHLANVRAVLTMLAGEAGIEEPEPFAHQWQMLMKGAIVAAEEGDPEAARRAREMGELLLRHHGIEV
jgi:AcrR family transcriptional regulator